MNPNSSSIVAFAIGVLLATVIVSLFAFLIKKKEGWYATTENVPRHYPPLFDETYGEDGQCWPYTARQTPEDEFDAPLNVRQS